MQKSPICLELCDWQKSKKYLAGVKVPSGLRGQLLSCTNFGSTWFTEAIMDYHYKLSVHR